MRLLVLLVSVIAHACFWNCDAGQHATNSLAAFNAAGQAGVWGCEFDVNFSSDGEVFVFHDGAVDGLMFNDNPAEAFAGCRLSNGEPIPRLEAFLEASRLYPEMKLVIELKYCKTVEMEKRFADAVVQKLREAELLDPSKVMFISFSQHICRHLVDTLPGFDVQFIHYGAPVGNMVPLGVSGHDIYYLSALHDGNLSAAAHAAGLQVNVWTVDKEEDMRALIAAGIDMLTTNRPDLAMSILSGQAL